MRKDYNRSISLLCPTCAGAEFVFDSQEDESIRVYRCAGCGLEFYHEQIMSSNSARVDAEVQKIKDDIIKDVRSDFRKAFKGLKGWKLN